MNAIAWLALGFFLLPYVLLAMFITAMVYCLFSQGKKHEN